MPIDHYRFHELGHVVLGHITDCADGESPCSRGVCDAPRNTDQTAAQQHLANLGSRLPSLGVGQSLKRRADQTGLLLGIAMTSY
jgi:hypothetical protein